MEFVAPQYAPYIAQMKQVVLQHASLKLVIQVESADDATRMAAFCRYHGIDAHIRIWQYRYRPDMKNAFMLIPQARRVELFPDAYLHLLHPTTQVIMCGSSGPEPLTRLTYSWSQK